MHDPFAASRPRPELPPPEPLDGRKPRVLAHVLRYFDWHSGGAERMLHGILRGLQQRGWDVEAVTVEYRGHRRDYEWDGVHVRVLTDSEMQPAYAWCDVAMTHLDVTSHAMAWARYGRPLAQIIHNHRQLVHHRVPDDGNNYPVWNSEWIAKEWSEHWQRPSLVCRPPSHSAEHATKVPNRHKLKTATLVNLLGEKGGPLFWRLARRLPDWRFLGAIGAYGMQHTPDPMPPNGVVVPSTTDMRTVWEQTSVLLVPAWYESFSLTACEACASGIPIIAHPTPGLLESMTNPELGEVALFRDRDDDQAWVDALASLESQARWRERSRLSLAHAEHLDRQSEADLDRLDGFLRAIVAERQPVSQPA